MNISFQIFSTMVSLLPSMKDNGQIILAEVHEINYHPDGLTFEVVIGFYDGSETCHRFVFFDEEASQALSIAQSSPFYREWNYEDYLD